MKYLLQGENMIKKYSLIALLVIGASTFTHSLYGAHELQRASRRIDKYLKHSSPTDTANVFEYLHYYPSWYQAVTPAPVTLVESLSHRARNLIESLKEIAKDFEIKPTPQLPGSSRLSPEGRAYYEEVIKIFKSKLNQ